jgi:hypothetical protein
LGSQSGAVGSSLPGAVMTNGVSSQDGAAERSVVVRIRLEDKGCRPKSVAVQPRRSFGSDRILRGSQLGSRRSVSVACHRCSVMMTRAWPQGPARIVACCLDSSGRQGLSTEPPWSSPQSRKSRRLEPSQVSGGSARPGTVRWRNDTIWPQGKNVSNVRRGRPEVLAVARWSDQRQAVDSKRLGRKVQQAERRPSLIGSAAPQGKVRRVNCWQPLPLTAR